MKYGPDDDGRNASRAGLMMTLWILALGSILLFGLVDLHMNRASHTVQPEVATLGASDTMRGIDPSTLPHGPPANVYDEYLSVWRAGYREGRTSCVPPVDPAHEWHYSADDALVPAPQ